MVEHRGFEPLTPTLPVWCASQLRQCPMNFFFYPLEEVKTKEKRIFLEITSTKPSVFRVTEIRPVLTVFNVRRTTQHLKPLLVLNNTLINLITFKWTNMERAIIFHN